MSDSIDLLDAIGNDASLRHASSEDLAQMLERAGASDALKAAAAHGSRDPLAVELGAQENHPPQIINSPSHEEEPDEDDKEAPVKPVTPDKQG